jgi:hypothetical protein
VEVEVQLMWDRVLDRGIADLEGSFKRIVCEII